MMAARPLLLVPALGVSLSSSTQQPDSVNTTMLAYTGKDESIINNAPPAIGAIIPPIRESAEAAPQAVPRTLVANISGVHPYNTAHMVVALRLIPTVVAVTANGSRTSTKATQSSAVTKVLPARARLLPSRGHSINHAPNTAPGHPPTVKITTFQRVLSSVSVACTCGKLGVCTRLLLLALPCRVSSSLGKYTLNIVYASDMPHQAPHTSMVVWRHSGASTIEKRPNQARMGRRMLRGSAHHARSATS